MGTRGMRAAVVLLTAILLTSFLVGTAHAMTLRQGDSVRVQSGERIDDDLYAFGSSIVIEGDVNGDVVAAGQTITISGKVTGNVMAAGQTVRVSGPVGGSIRAAGSQVDIAGDTAKDAVAAGSDVTLSGKVGRDVAAAGNTVTISNAVAGGARLSGASVSIAAPIAGDVNAQAERLTITPQGSVGGNLDYTSARPATVQGQVNGRTVRHEPPSRQRDGGGAAGVFFGILAWIQGLVGLAVFGLGMVLLFPGASHDAAVTVLDRPLPSIGIGLLLFFGVPFVALLVFVIGLVIGVWWLSFVLLAIYWIALIAGLIVASLALGRLILRGAVSHGLHDLWAMLLGLAVLWFVSAIPFVGWLVGWLATMFGLGALLLAALARRPLTQTTYVQPRAAHPTPYGHPQYPASPGYPPGSPPAYPQQPYPQQPTQQPQSTQQTQPMQQPQAPAMPTQPQTTATPTQPPPSGSDQAPQGNA